MELLKHIDIAPCARMQYPNAASRAEWGPRIQAASRVYYELEEATIIAGMRKCTTRHVSPERMDEELRRLADRGLMFLPLQRVGSYSGFAHYHPPVISGQPWSWYGPVAARPEDAATFARATASGDHDTIGDLLGYPKCCREFFNTVWRAGYVDPVWQQAEKYRTGKYTAAIPDQRAARLTQTLRYIGVRLAPHLPCSYDCADSHRMADEWEALGRKIDPDGMDALLRLLAVPHTWDCLKGVAIITSPHFRIVTNSVPCAQRHVMYIGGDHAPVDSR